MLFTTDEILVKLAGASIFTSLGAASGFWQIPLCENSSLLTAIITPVARYCFKRLLFGISIAPETFQRKMNKLVDMEGVAAFKDGVIMYRKDQTVHYNHLKRVLERMEIVGLKLNKDKCVFRKAESSFLGHVVDAQGVRADLGKVRAISDLQKPNNVNRLRMALGLKLHE